MKIDKYYKFGLCFQRASLPAYTASNHTGILPKVGDFRVRRNMRTDMREDKKDGFYKASLQTRAESSGSLGRFPLKAGLE